MGLVHVGFSNMSITKLLPFVDGDGPVDVMKSQSVITVIILTRIRIV